MRENTKKLLSLFLALIIILASFTTSAVATEFSSSSDFEKEKLEPVLPDGVESYEYVSPDKQTPNGSSAILAVTDTIEDGVYAIMSYASSYRWMTVENGDYQAGKHIQQSYSTTLPTEDFYKARLFKISQVGTTGRYIIRSMVNNNLSFGISGTEIITKVIPNNDSDVSASDTFYIEVSGSGYLIRPYGSTHVLNMVSSSTTNLSTVIKTNATDNARWQLAKYTGSHQSGMTLYRPSSWASTGNIVGSTSQATIVSWSTYINANNLSVSVASGYENLGSLTWSDSTKTFTLTAQNPGTIRISAKIVYGGTTTAVYSGYFSHIIVPKQGTYYIQNAGTEKYVDVEGPSSASGALIQQWQFHTGNSEKWTLQHVSGSGGYVRFKSAYSNLYLGVDSSNTASVKQYSTQNDYTLWKIERTSVGNQKLICKATESSGLVLSVPLSSNINGTDLTQISYTSNTNYRDEWKMYIISSYTVNIETIYDYAYINRYSSADDRINNQILKLQEKYLQIAGITVNNTGVSAFSSYGDSCSTTHTTACGHATNSSCYNSLFYSNVTVALETYHHKNINNIMARISFPNTSQSLKIAYIGHNNCGATRDSSGNLISHLSNPHYGLTQKKFGLSVIMNFTSVESETKTLLHEFGHFYDIEDHYGEGGKSTDQMNHDYPNRGYDSFCIYGEDKDESTVLSNLTICDGCIYTLVTNIAKYNH